MVREELEERPPQSSLQEGSPRSDAEGDEVRSAIHRLRHYGPIPFPSKALEDEYKLFCAPGALVLPIWQTNLFLQTFSFFQQQSPLNETSTEKFLYNSRFILMATGLILTAADLALIVAKQILVIRLRQRSSRETSKSQTRNESPSDQVEAYSFPPSRHQPTDSTDTASTGLAIEEAASQLHRLRYLQHLMRLVSMVILFATNVVNAVNVWTCYSTPGISPAWPHVCHIRAVAALPTQIAWAHLLRAPLHWESLRLLIISLLQTVFAFSPLNTHPIEFRYHFFITQWVISAAYYLMSWDSDRESRERFLATKVLADLERSAELGRFAVLRTLSGLCEPSRLPLFLEGSRIRDQGKSCAILITTIYDYARWRQQATVSVSMYSIDLWVTEVEALRKTHPGISLMEIAGDAIITASNLNDSSGSAQEEAPGSHDGFHSDPSDIILFAFRQLTCTRLILARQDLSSRQLRSAAEIMKQIGSLDVRLGLGFGPCQAEVLKGNGAFNVLHGQAFEEAKRALLVSTPQSLDIPLAFIAMCNRVTVSHSQGNAEGKVRVKNVRRKSVGQLLPHRSGVGSLPPQVSSDNEVSYRLPVRIGLSADLQQAAEQGVGASSRIVSSEVKSSPGNPTTSPCIIPIDDQQGERDDVETQAKNSFQVGEPELDQWHPRDRTEQRSQLRTNPLSENIARSELVQLSSALAQVTNRGSSVTALATRGDRRVFETLPEAASGEIEADEVPNTATAGYDSTAPGWGALLWDEVKTELKATAILFEPVLENEYANWLENRLQQRRNFIGLLWTTLFIAFMVPYVAQEAVTPVSLGLVLTLGALLVSYLLLGCQCRRPAVEIDKGVDPDSASLRTKIVHFVEAVTSVRYQTAALGALQCYLTLLAAHTAKPHFIFGVANWFPSLLWNFAFCTFSADGISLLLSLVLVFLGNFFVFALRGFTDGLVSVLVLVPAPFLMLVGKANVLRREFEVVKNQRTRQLRAEQLRKLHEEVLNRILPPYIVTHVAKLDAVGARGPISDQLHDVAMLLCRLPVMESINGQVAILTFLQDRIESLPGISLIYTDGDTAMIAGPLVRPPPQPPSSTGSSRTVASRTLLSANQRLMGPRMAMEAAATESSNSLLLLLSALMRYCAEKRQLDATALRGSPENLRRLTAVLHRGDGVAAVFRRRRPVFCLEGVTTERARALLQNLEPGVSCMTKVFAELSPVKLAKYPSSYGLVVLQSDVKQPTLKHSRDARLEPRATESALLPLSHDLFEEALTQQQKEGGSAFYHPRPVQLRLRGLGYVAVLLMKLLTSDLVEGG